MNSLTLKENGFADFIPLKGLQFTNLPPNQDSVIVLADSTLTGKPTSDILYIGKSKKPTKRLFGGYIAGYGGKTTRKIHAKLNDDGYMEKVAVSWMLSDDPKKAQKELLENFKKEHGQYPSWNTQKKPSRSALPQKASKIVKASPVRKSTKSKT
jgi:hypothetical protein